MCRLWGRTCRTGLQSTRKVGSPELNRNYHDELGSELGFGIDLAVKLVVLLDPAHRTDGNCNTFISFGVVIVGYYHSIGQIYQLSGFLLIYFTIRLRIESLKPDEQQLLPLISRLSDLLQYILHAKWVFVVGCHEG